MTKKDYELIASVIKRSTEWTKPVHIWDKEQIACGLAEALQAQNPKFNRSKFMKACRIEA